ncbi:hypothetical protein Bbelb_041350 [Branchiostoma belcheri]|nr:hypothetical protein Bbelb_041350 [Branchiostoma belcheri]
MSLGILLCVVPCFLLCTCHGLTVYNTSLDTSNRVQLLWHVDYGASTVIFKLSADAVANGFALGMSPDGTMRNADFVVFWTEENSVNAVDSWTDGRGRFHKDKSQDYRLMNSTSNGQKISVTFSRRFDTCDEHDYLIDSGTTNLLYILSEEDITDVSDLNSPAMRMRVGTKRLQLLKSDVVTPPLPPDVTSFDIRVNQYEPIITPGNEETVHHMTVFLCGNDVSGAAVYDGPCVGEEERKELKTCKHVIAAWAMGAQAFAYPEEAGIPLGGPGSSTIAMIEIHYNTHNGETQPKYCHIVDSSGVRFHYTPTLRRHDAGIMELGLRYLPSMAIPPRQDGYVITGYCPAQCTTKGLPAGGIQVFASQLHTHLAGTAVWTKHVRGVVELPELNRDNHYSTMFENNLSNRSNITADKMESPVLMELAQGDVLMTSCQYNTTNRRSVTLGGYGIHDEMCLNYIHYYPRLTATGLHQNVADDFSHLPWNPLTTAYLTSLYRHGQIDAMCQKTTGAIFEGEWTNLEQPHIRTSQNPQQKCRA